MGDRGRSDRVLSETPADHLEPAVSEPKDDRADRVGDVLQSVLKRLGLTKEVATQGALGRWDQVVGDRIAAVARATAVSRGVLFVEVSSSAWLSELNLMRKDILSRLNAGSGDGRIERIVFTLSEQGVRRPDADD